MTGLLDFLGARGLDLPAEFEALYAALPGGADLGTVRLLSPEEIAAPGPAPVSLLPIATGGEQDAFAFYVPAGPVPRPSAVCMVDRETGCWAPIASNLRGFGAWLLLLRRAQASLPAGPGFAVRELLSETRGAAAALAAALGLEPLMRAVVEPDARLIASALSDLDPGSPWACSILARLESEPAAALARLSPALSAAPFSAGLLEQAAALLGEGGDLVRAVRATFAALDRLEPNLQVAPFRLDEPDGGAGHSQAFDPAAAFRFLREHSRQTTPEMRRSAPWQFLGRVLDEREGRLPEIAPDFAIDQARRRGLGGDLPGGRWILHLAIGSCFGDPDARRPLAEELARAYRLAGMKWHEGRCRALAGRARHNSALSPPA